MMGSTCLRYRFVDHGSGSLLLSLVAELQTHAFSNTRLSLGESFMMNGFA